MTPTTAPEITIGLPVYNGAKALPDTLRNLQAQSFENFVIIISDNASTDETPRICEDFAARDSRIHYYRQPQTTNPTRNFRFVLDKTETPFFMWCAHDDTRDPDFIEVLLGALKQRADAVLSFGDVVQYIDGTAVPLRLDFEPKNRSRLQHLYWSAVSPLHHLYGVWRTQPLQSLRWQHTNWWHDTPLMMAACFLGDFIYVPGVRLHYLYNEHHFMDWKRRPGVHGFFAGAKALGSRGFDLAHLILQSGLTVGRVGGIGYGIAGSACAGAKVCRQIAGFTWRRLTGRRPDHRRAVDDAQK